MLRVPGEFLLEALTGRPWPTIRASLGPYDGSVAGAYAGTSDLSRDIQGLEVTLPDPDDPFGSTEDRPEFVVADLTDRLIGIGSISHRIPILADSLETSELVLEISNDDNAFSPIAAGTPRDSIPHQQLLLNRTTGSVLRVEIGIRDRDGVPHYVPSFEGIIRGVEHGNRSVSLKASDPTAELNRTILPTPGPTYSAVSPTDIIADLWANYTTESGTLGRPLLYLPDLEAASAVAPFTLTINNSGDATLSGLPLAEAMAIVARHGFASIWIDGKRRIRYTMREVGETTPDFRLDYDRNLISGRLSLDLAFLANKVTGTYGPAASAITTTENAESQSRYGVREVSLSLPFLSSLADADAYAERYAIEFAWPLLTYNAVADLSAVVLEPGDWPRVNHPGDGIGGLRFQVHDVDFDPAGRTVSITMHNTDPSITEGGAFLVGISKVDSGDAFL